MRSRPSTSFIIFLMTVVFLILFFISVYEAYSVYISLSESSIEPLPERTSIKYLFSKNGEPSRYAEVRTIKLITSGTTVTSSEITWYRGFPGGRGYYVTITVTLKDNSGNSLSSGSVTGCYTGKGFVISNIDLNPHVNIDSIGIVETSIIIGAECRIEGASTSSSELLQSIQEIEEEEV